MHGDLGGSNLLWAGPAPRFRLTGILDWDEAHLGSQAMTWPAGHHARLAGRRPARHGGRCPTIADARIIQTTLALQQALPAALSGTPRHSPRLTRYTAD